MGKYDLIIYSKAYGEYKILDYNIKYDEDGTISGRNASPKYTSKLAESSSFGNGEKSRKNEPNDELAIREQDGRLRVNGFGERSSNNKENDEQSFSITDKDISSYNESQRQEIDELKLFKNIKKHK